MNGEEQARSDVSRRWLILAWALVLGFLVTGVFGRSLWKADEPYSFGIVWDMLEDHRWLIPHIAGEPFVEKPPLVYWTAALFATAFSAFPPDQSARLAVLLFAGISVGALYAAARRLHPEASAWRDYIGSGNRATASGAIDLSPHAYATLGMLLMVGTLGFAEHIHKLTADIGQLAGAAMGLCGLIYIGTSGATDRDTPRARHPCIANGLLLGTGAGVAFMSKGLLVPGLLAVTCVSLLALPAFRSRAALRAYAIAGMAALPWITVWPALFYVASPDLFGEWLWNNNLGRFLGSTLLGGNHRSLANKAEALAGAAFPATLLVAIVVWALVSALARGGDRSKTWRFARNAPGHVCIAAFLVISVAALGVSASMRDIYILPLLPAMVLLGLPALLLGPSSTTKVAQAVAVVSFGAIVALIFAVFAHLVAAGNLAGLGRIGPLLGRILPLPYVMPVSWPALGIALVAIIAWLYLVRHDGLRSATIAWCGGVAALWIVGSTLLLPWIDSARSYEGVFGVIATHVAPAKGCVATLNLGESEISLLEYVAGIEPTRAYLGHSGTGDPHRPNPAIRNCEWLIALSNRRSGPQDPDPRYWRHIQTISRPADRNERFAIYRATGVRDETHPERVP